MRQLALQAARDDHQQLRLAAVAEMEAFKHREAGRRFESQSRYKWLLAVKETTAPIREYAASKHAMRAWMELQPLHEQPKKRPMHHQTAVRLRWCECQENLVVSDVFGTDEPSAAQWIGGVRHCTNDACRRVVRPAEEAGWEQYARAVVERAHSARWCVCTIPNYVVVGELPYCADCNFGVVRPHPIKATAEQCIALYRTVFETFFVESTMSYTRAAECWVALNQALKGAIGYGLGDGPERDAALLDQLAETTGLPRLDARRVKSPAVDDDWEEGKLPGLNGNIRGFIWHKQRELGQIDRIERVLQCSKREMKARCGACEKQGPSIKLGCSNTRLCWRCRAVRVRRFQNKFERARKERTQALWADRRRLVKANYRRTNDGGRDLRYGGPWAERFLTLTVPHSGNAHHDVQELQRAWRRFWRLVSEHIKKDLLRGERANVVRDVMAHLAYCRVLEVTPGNNWEGHAHIHVWFLGPFIHHELLRHMWGESLSGGYQTLLANAGAIRAVDEAVAEMPATRRRFEGQLRSYLVTRRGKHGQPLAAIWWPVVDVRKVDRKIASELCKYLIKDGERNNAGQLELVHPEVFAVMYAALEGQRAISCTRGLMVVIRLGCHCQECGGAYTRWIVDLGPEESEAAPRGPPTDQLTMGFP